MPTERHDLFVSHADSDRWWVDGFLLDALRAAGLSVVSDAAFRPGRPRLDEFQRAVTGSARTLLVLSPAYVADGMAAFVSLLAQQYGVDEGEWPVIPLLLHDVPALDPRLSMLVKLDARGEPNWLPAVERLCAELRSPAPEPEPRIACPYPGMRPFGTAEQGAFFGREAESRLLVDQHLRLHPFVAIIGASGSGKSSLAFAGLVPALRESQFFAGETWLTRSCRPGGADPLAALNAAVADSGGSDRRLLIVDQFEELFTTMPPADKPAREAFGRALLALADSGGWHVVLTVRADFYRELMELELLWPRIRHHRFELPPLGREALAQAITGPAGRARVEVEPALLQRLLSDAGGEPGILPFLQETLLMLWGGLRRRCLPLAAYDRLLADAGGPGQGARRAHRNGLEVAMAARAEQVFAALPSDAARELAGRVLLRLVQFGEGRADTRRQQTVARLRGAEAEAGVFAATLGALIKARLLTASAGEGQHGDATAIDLAHEALLGGWPRLAAWIAQRREAEQMRRWLRQMAEKWLERQTAGQRGGLLDEVELPEAERWRERHGALVGIDPLVEQLIAASATERKRVRDEDEARRLLDIARQHAIDDAERARLEQVALQQRERATAQRRAAWGLAIAGVLVLSLLGWVLAQTRALGRQTSLSLANAAQRAADEGRFDQATRLGILAARSSWLGPAHPNAWPVLARAADANRLRMLVARHRDRVFDARYSPDGRRIVTASADGTALVWDAATGEPLVPPMAHAGLVRAAAFSPDGTRLLTTTLDGDMRLWDAATGRLVLGPFGGGHQAVAASFSPDSRWVITPMADGRAIVRDARTGAPDGEPLRAQGKIRLAVYSPDGQRILTASTDHAARLWSAAARQPLGEPMRHGAAIDSLRFSPDGTRLVTAAEDSKARLWDAATGLPLGQPMEHRDVVSSATFSPDGTRIVTASEDHGARLWDATTGRPIGLPMAHGDDVHFAEFSPDGLRVATASGDHHARLWDARTGAPASEPLWHGNAVWSAVFSPDGRRLLTASSDAMARIYEVDPTRPAGSPIRTGGETAFARFSPDGRAVLTSGGDAARLWDAGTGQPIGAAMTQPDRIASADFSADGKRLVTLADDHGAQVWDASTGLPVGPLMTGDRLLTCAAISPDGQRAALGDFAGRVSVRKVGDAAGKGAGKGALNGPLAVASGGVNGAPRAAASGAINGAVNGAAGGAPAGQHTGPVSSLRFSPDGRRLVSASVDGTARVWDAAGGAPLGPPMAHGNMVRSAAFSPDGERIVTVALLSTARVWRVDGGEPVGRPMEHGSIIASAGFSPDGRRVLTASVDREARTWDAATGAPLGEPMAHGSPLLSARFSADGRQVLTATADGARLWHAETGREMAAPMVLDTPVVAAEFSPDGQRILVATKGQARVWRAPWSGVHDTKALLAAACARMNPEARRLTEEDARLATTISRDRKGEDVCTGRLLPSAASAAAGASSPAR